MAVVVWVSDVAPGPLVFKVNAVTQGFLLFRQVMWPLSLLFSFANHIPAILYLFMLYYP